MAQQRIAVVTGGMGGLGESISTKMADAGYRVVVTYSPSNTKYKSWLDEMKAQGYAFGAYPVDVANYDDCAAKAARMAPSCMRAVRLISSISSGLLITLMRSTRSLASTNLLLEKRPLRK